VARVLNVAMHMMVEVTAPKDQASLVSELTGPYRTVGTAIKPDEVNAPAWWHGEEEAYQMAESLMSRRRGRR